MSDNQAPARNLILPGNPRYQPKELTAIFGYDNLYRSVGQVEIATLEVLHEVGFIPDKDMAYLTDELKTAILEIPTSAVDKTEREITKHDIRAWVMEAQKLMPPSLGRWVHVFLTSYDPLDTGRSLQFVAAYEQALGPSLKQIILILADLVERFADTVQIGRTHGQHALPITVGFWLATILNRLIYNAGRLKADSQELIGKISGAVGAYNAQVGLGLTKLCGDLSFEARVMRKLNLYIAPISTQILPPEPLAHFLFDACLTSATFAQLGRDARHLMRSEIAEVAEVFEADQVGSSTMAHKRNPINWENLEGMWLRTKNEFGKVMDTLISEHQRDLVGSSVYRDFPIILINLQQQMNTLLRAKDGVPFLSRITVNPEACEVNFERSARLILAEPLYIALQVAGYESDAHRLVNHTLVPLATLSGRSLIEELEDLADYDDAVKEAFGNIPEDTKALLYHPENYIGLASEKAYEVVYDARDVANNL